MFFGVGLKLLYSFVTDDFILIIYINPFTNATMEASRASGDTGSSFAVVAEEVRSLAKRSANAAANTSDIIDKNIALANEGKNKRRSFGGVNVCIFMAM